MDGLKKGQEDKFVHHRAHAKEVLLEKLGQNVECRKLTAVLYGSLIQQDYIGIMLFTSHMTYLAPACLKRLAHSIGL